MLLCSFHPYKKGLVQTISTPNTKKRKYETRSKMYEALYENKYEEKMGKVVNE